MNWKHLDRCGLRRAGCSQGAGGGCGVDGLAAWGLVGLVSPSAAQYMPGVTAPVAERSLAGGSG